MADVSAPRTSMRDTILDAVDRLLARYGYQKMSLEDVAREAGISRRTIYVHFPGKEELVLSSIDRVVDRLLVRLEAVAGSSLPADERLRELVMTRILFRLDSVSAYSEGLETLFAALRPAYLARRERYFEAEAGIFARVLERGVREGLFACDATLETAHTILIATNALLPYSLSARELGTREEVAARAARIADLLLDGVRRRPR